MSAIRAVLVDDMAPARAKLRRYVAEDCRVTVVGEAASCRQAASLIDEHRPQLAFLDIHLPDGSGMDLIDGLDVTARPISIFVTAFDQYALRAFEMDARDYLLKPFARERFVLALNRAIEKLSYRQATQDVAKERQYIQQISVKDKNGRWFMDLNEIDAIVADDHYLRVSWGGRVHLIRGSLRALQRELDPDGFMRVHRSAMVRIASIKRIRERKRGDYAIELQSGTAVPISRRYHTAIRARFSLRSL
jgi:two-component system LytT family response regulator